MEQYCTLPFAILASTTSCTSVPLLRSDRPCLTVTCGDVGLHPGSQGSSLEVTLVFSVVQRDAFWWPSIVRHWRWVCMPQITTMRSFALHLFAAILAISRSAIVS